MRYPWAAFTGATGNGAGPRVTGIRGESFSGAMDAHP